MFCLDASDEAEAAFERMLGACKVVLAWYGGVLEEGFECVPTPPMGSHIIRRRSIGDNDELDAQHHTHMANLGEFFSISVFILILIRAIGVTACFVQLFMHSSKVGERGPATNLPGPPHVPVPAGPVLVPLRQGTHRGPLLRRRTAAHTRQRQGGHRPTRHHPR